MSLLLVVLTKEGCKTVVKAAFFTTTVRFLPFLEMLASGLAASGMALEKQCSANGVKHCLLAGFLMTWQVSAWPCRVPSELLGVHGLICVHMAAVWPFVCFEVAFQPYCRWSTTHYCFVFVQRKTAGRLCGRESRSLKPDIALLGVQLLVQFLFAFFG